MPEQLGPTRAARQGLLKAFFEPGGGEDPTSLGPSRAHRAIAELSRKGLVKVIITTNFDRLMEQALDGVGIQPQVISRPSAVNGMVPLAHAPVTLVKIHGDYRDVDSLNTETELSRYPPPWTRLLNSIVEDYGLVVSGWSADWDSSLARIVEGAKSHRYSLFWHKRSSGGSRANQLLEHRKGYRLEANTADELFESLLENIESLDQLTQAPLTTGMSIARAKRYVPDPVRRVALHDLVMGEVDVVLDAISAMVNTLSSGVKNYGDVEAETDQLSAASQPLLRTIAHATFHDDGSHDALWTRVVQRLLDGSGEPTKVSPADIVRNLSHLPALLAMYTYAIVGNEARQPSAFLAAALHSSYVEPFAVRDREPGIFATSAARVLHANVINAVEELRSGSRWLFPQSHRARGLLKNLTEEFVPHSRADEAFDDAEYRIGLLQHVTKRSAGSAGTPHSGEFCHDHRWDDGIPWAEKRFVADLRNPRVKSEWTKVIDGDLLPHLESFRETLKAYRRW